MSYWVTVHTRFSPSSTHLHLHSIVLVNWAWMQAHLRAKRADGYPAEMDSRQVFWAVIPILFAIVLETNFDHESIGEDAGDDKGICCSDLVQSELTGKGEKWH